MSEDQFWVNPDALANSAGGFHEKAASVTHLMGRINDLSSPDRAEIVGLDSQGQGVWKQLQDSSAELHKGLTQWREGISGTGDAVVQSAKVFGATEENNEKLASRLIDPDSAKNAAELRQLLPEAPRESTPRLAEEAPRQKLAMRSENPAHLLASRTEAEQPLFLASRTEAVQGRQQVADGVEQPRFLASRTEAMRAPEQLADGIEEPRMMMGERREGTPLMPLMPVTERERGVLPDAMPAERFSASEPGTPLLRGEVREEAPLLVRGQVTEESPALVRGQVRQEAPLLVRGQVTEESPLLPRSYQAQEFSELQPAIPGEPVTPAHVVQGQVTEAEFAPTSRLEPAQFSPALPGIPAEPLSDRLDPMVPVTPALPTVPAEPRVPDES
jgi:hypothetical protein